MPLAGPRRARGRAAAGTRTAALLLVGLVLVSLNLRPAIASVPPLLGAVERDLALSGAGAGLLTTLPVLCMGLLAPLGGWLTRHEGRERAIGWALVAVGLGTGLRLVAGSALVLFATTIIAGAGIAIAGTLLPALVKADFPHRAGAATGVYTMALAAGATLASALSVPLADVLASWQRSLASWALLAVAALVVWTPLASRSPSSEPAPDTAHGLPWRSARAWTVAAYLSLQSCLFYTLLTWIPALYQSLGRSPRSAGLLLGAFNLVQVVFALAIPALSDRTATRLPWFALALSGSIAGLAVLLVAPLAAPWLAMAVLGLGMGGGFGLELTLLVDSASDPAASMRLSTMAFVVSYSAAAAGPVLVGALRDLTGGFRVALGWLMAVAVAQLAISWVAATDRAGSRCGSGP